MMRWRLNCAVTLCGVAALSLAGCSDGEQARKGPSSTDSTPVALAAKDEVRNVVGGLEGTTPMAERVAVIGLLNKRNNQVRNLEMKPGESIRVGRAVVRLRACEQAPAWEMPAETGAFVQLLTLERDGKWKRSFSGWLFRERPELNVVQHPIYDVIVKSCAMITPGGGPAVMPGDVSGDPADDGIGATKGNAATPASKAVQLPPSSPAAAKAAGDRSPASEDKADTAAPKAE